MHSDSLFEEGVPLVNAYFVKVDASGHSAIVRENPSDKADLLFDLLEKSIYDLVQSRRTLNDCAYAEFWGWQGDGGLCVIYDSHESKANTTALESAIAILERGLPGLREDFRTQGIRGDLHLRVAIHKGAFRYKECHGSIHSRELNFVAHLESVAPRDALVISRAVLEASSAKLREKFTPLDFSFEGEDVYILQSHSSPAHVFEWIARIPIEGSFQLNTVAQRPSQAAKARIMSHAVAEVVDCGTALSTCSNYLLTREKPGEYRQQVLELLRRGVNYVCLVLNPDAEIANTYEKARGEELVKKIRASLERLESFSAEVQDLPGDFKVVAYDALPHFAAIAIDRDADGMLLVSPYMPSAVDFRLERGDTMHYFLRREQDEGLYEQVNGWIDYYKNGEQSIEIL